ncbi:MAG: VCBS repeat-containing protein [Planctomycetes bacterium]|nr:VCBS repeat-containing protein [Planctomycetota bacterium]
MRRLQAVAFVVASFALPASAQSNVATFWGSTVDEAVATAMDEVGDLNGDGYHDMVVGAPGGGNSSAIYFVSGKYLETGNGVPTFGSTFSTPQSSFGRLVLSVGDVTNDGIGDVFVGDSTATGAFLTRRAAVVSGASKAIVGAYEAASFSASIATACRYGDYDGDGRIDVLANSPASVLSSSDDVFLLSPRKLVTGASPVLVVLSGSPNIGFGQSVAAGDFDGDGKPEIVVGAPLWSSDTGRVYIYRGSDQSLMRILSGSSTSKFGSALDASWDIDHDGVKDLIVGAPYSDANGTDAGEAILFSGQRIAVGLPFMDLVHWTGAQAGSHFGATVAMTEDTNGDFKNDVIVAAPEYSTTFPIASSNRGAVYWFSGETLEPLGRLLGSTGERLGRSLSRAWDYTNDGRYEIAAGAPGSDFGASNAGIMRLATLFPVGPTSFCTGKVNSQGCTPAIGFSGSPSVSSSSAFNVKATNVINNKNGLLFYSYDASNLPFQGGLLCVKSPTKRTAVQNSGGNQPPNDCSGTYSYDFNARIQSGIDPLLTKGQEVFCQYWSRDIASPSGTSLSNALRFVINP